jgi:hypothetical protein
MPKAPAEEWSESEIDETLNKIPREQIEFLAKPITVNSAQKSSGSAVWVT